MLGSSITSEFLRDWEYTACYCLNQKRFSKHGNEKRADLPVFLQAYDKQETKGKVSWKLLIKLLQY